MTMTANTATIGVAVTEAQAILTLVAKTLDVDQSIEPTDAFTLFAAVEAAIGRLDEIHDVLQASAATPATPLARARGALQ